MLNYSKKALVNTGQGAKRANPRVYTAAASLVQLRRTKRRNHWKLIPDVVSLSSSRLIHFSSHSCLWLCSVCKYVWGVVMREGVFFVLNILVWSFLVVGRQTWKIQHSVVGWAKVGSPGSLWTNWDILQLSLWWCSIYEQALVHCVSKVGVKKGWAVWRQRSDVKVLWVQPYRTPVAGNTQAYRGDFQFHLGFLTSRKT